MLDPRAKALRQRTAPLLELVERFRSSDATRQLDKVYSLLALSSDTDEFPQLCPDYTISAHGLACKLVRFAFPTAVLSEPSASTDSASFEVEGLVIGELSSVSNMPVRARGAFERQLLSDYYTFTAKVRTDEDDKPEMLFNPVVRQIFSDTWILDRTNERRYSSGSLVCLLKDASRPTVLIPTTERCIVDTIASPEPYRMTTTGAEHEHVTWKWAMDALAGETEGTLPFKMSWDPFCKPTRPKHEHTSPGRQTGKSRWKPSSAYCGTPTLHTSRELG